MTRALLSGSCSALSGWAKAVQGRSSSSQAAATDLGSVRMFVVRHPVAAVLFEAVQGTELLLQQLFQLQHAVEHSAAQKASQSCH